MYMPWLMCGGQRIIYGNVSFQYVGLRDQSQVVRLDGSCLSLLPGPMHSQSTASLSSISLTGLTGQPTSAFDQSLHLSVQIIKRNFNYEISL